MNTHADDSTLPGSPSVDEEPAKAWLRENFERRRLSTVSNWAHYGVRNGATTAAAVAQSVRRQALAKLGSPWSDAADQAFTQSVLDALRDDPDGARAYFEWVLAWERLPEPERRALKDARSEQASRQWMKTQPATDRQVAYLRKLGYRGEVTSKAHASTLLDGLTGSRR